MSYRRGGVNPSAASGSIGLSVVLAAICFGLLIPALNASAQTNLTLGWGAPNLPGITQYKIYYGSASRNYTNSVIVNGTQATVNGLKPGTIYFFSVVALDATLGESPFSAEVRYPDISPAIALTSPANGATYDSAASLTVAASVNTNGHTINSVRFYNGSTLLGTDTLPPYSYTLSKAASNSYSFYAKLTYDGTNSISSSVVNVSASGSLIGNSPLLLATAPSTNRQFRLTLSGQPSHTYDILASQDLKVWKAISTVTLGASGSVAFTDPQATKYSSRFYRLHETTYTLPGTLPTLQIRRVASGLGSIMALNGAGQVGHTYDILASDDLKTWIAINTFTVGANGAFSFLDLAAAAHSSRFYRLHETTYTLPDTLPAVQIHSAAGKVYLTTLGEIGHKYDVLASQDFTHWSAITNVIVPASGTITVNDPAAALFRSRFYRLHETTY